MVGGVIIGFVRHPDNTLVHVQDPTYGDKCSLRIQEQRRDDGSPVDIKIGDKLWWQRLDAMWTPGWCKVARGGGCGTDWDIRLPRIGYSH